MWFKQKNYSKNIGGENLLKENNVWFEKHRPQTFEEIVGQDEIINVIIPRLDNLTHMIFEGKAGTGKTTTAQVIAKTINADFMELNSSEERGLDTVRGKITNFCRHLSFNDAPYKILFLDEADNMTNDAQAALRPIIEKYSHNCRFIIGCNYIDKIIPPIKDSRCKIYRFKPINNNDVVKRLRLIAERENIHMSISEKDYVEIAENSRGDMRKAINKLQMGDYGHTEVAQVFTL